MVRKVNGYWIVLRKAGDLLRDLAALAGGKGGGKGGGKPDQARGAAPDRSMLEEIKAAMMARVSYS